MLFIEVPIELALKADLEVEEMTNVEAKTEKNFCMINIDSITFYHPQDDDESTQVFFDSGQGLVISLNYLEFKELIAKTIVGEPKLKIRLGQ